MKRAVQISLLALCALLILGEGLCLALGTSFIGSPHHYDRAFAPLFIGISAAALLITGGIAYGVLRWYRKTPGGNPPHDPES